jgi:predicted AAA+ superfamily ATPase
MKRIRYLKRLKEHLRVHPAVVLLGPRQCGKTTLAEMYATQQDYMPVNRFDLEDPADLARLDHPMLALENLEGLIIIDEIQRKPQLFPILRVLIDKNKHKQRYLILGSASRELIQQSSETLAGRISYIEVTPFSFIETLETDKLWVRGGYPLSYLAQKETDSFLWLKSYTTTFLEQDIPNLGLRVSPSLLRRFWMMIAHYHGNIINLSEIGKSLGLSHVTIRHYIDILVSTFMLRELQPWFANINKRQIKSSKIYFKDSGILHYLLGINSQQEILRNPKLGASWEGFALEQIIRAYEAEPPECYFWAVHNQGELDLMILRNGKRLGFEFKYTDAPKLTPSIKMAIEHLELDQLMVIYPGRKEYWLADNIKVTNLEYFSSHLKAAL